MPDRMKLAAMQAAMDQWQAQQKSAATVSSGPPSFGNPSLEPGAEKGMDPGLADPIELAAQGALLLSNPEIPLAKGIQAGAGKMFPALASKVMPKIMQRALNGGASFAAFGAANDALHLKNPLPNIPGNFGMGMVGGPVLGKINDIVGGKIVSWGAKQAAQAAQFEKEVMAAKELPSGEVLSARDKLLQAIKDAPDYTPEQLRNYKAGRAAQFTAGRQVAEATAGLPGFWQEKSVMKGAFKQPNFQSIKPLISPEDTQELFETIKRSKALDYPETLAARQALVNLLQPEGGKLPAPAELEKLSRVFGDEFVKTIRAKGPQISLLRQYGYEVANLPRELMASFDLSAPLRQGLLMISHPKQFVPAFGEMFKYFGNKEYFDAAMQSIKEAEHAGLARRSGLSLSAIGPGIGQREEAFQSNLGERIPIIGPIVAGSNRAYTGFLNKVRSDVFGSLTNDAINMAENAKLMAKFRISNGDLDGAKVFLQQAKDLDPYRNTKLANDLAKYINVSTGRGGGKFISEHGAMLNSAFFAPRLIASRLEALNPAYYINLHPFVRNQAVRSMLTLGSATLTTAAIARMSGADVEIDPNNPDFLKIKIGNTRYDIMGGFQQYIRLGALLTKEVYDRSRGDQPNDVTQALARFARTKESPLASLLHDYLAGSDLVHEPFDPATAIGKRFVPMFIQDVVDVSKEWGPAKGIPMALPGAFGVGVQDYDN